MTKQVEVIYEQGRLRPLESLQLPEGTRLSIILVTGEGVAPRSTPAEILAEIAALPLEGATDPFSGADHDAVLYPQK